MTTLRQVEKTLFSFYQDGVAMQYIHKLSEIGEDKELFDNIVNKPEEIDKFIKKSKAKADFDWFAQYYGARYYQKVVDISYDLPVQHVIFVRFNHIFAMRLKNRIDVLAKIKELLQDIDCKNKEEHIQWLESEMSKDFVSKTGMKFDRLS